MDQERAVAESAAQFSVEEVRAQRFSLVRWRGYAIGEVEAFVERVAHALAVAAEQRDALGARAAELAEELSWARSEAARVPGLLEELSRAHADHAELLELSGVERAALAAAVEESEARAAHAEMETSAARASLASVAEECRVLAAQVSELEGRLASAESLVVLAAAQDTASGLITSAEAEAAALRAAAYDEARRARALAWQAVEDQERHVESLASAAESVRSRMSEVLEAVRMQFDSAVEAAISVRDEIARSRPASTSESPAPTEIPAQPGPVSSAEWLEDASSVFVERLEERLGTPAPSASPF